MHSTLRPIALLARWRNRLRQPALVLLTMAVGSVPALGQPVANPRVVELRPSADHNTTLATGAPAVTRYSFDVYMQGATAPFHSVDMGKPGPQGDGFIRYDFSSGIAAWPLPGGVYEARVAAIGPQGTGRSDVSNPFTIATAACTYTVSPTSASVPSAGGSTPVTVTTPAGCAWTAASSASWITVSSASGSSTATVTVTASPNSATTARTGTATIAGQVVNLTQAAAACTYAVSPRSASVTSGGGTTPVTVTTPTGCGWTAASGVAWITVSAANGSGPATITVTASPNTAGTSRSGKVTIAGSEEVTVAQSAGTCASTLSPDQSILPKSGGNGTFTLTTSGECAWAVVSDVTWITVAPSSGQGTATVGFTVAPNDSSLERTGHLIVDGQTFTVTQLNNNRPAAPKGVRITS